MFRDAFIVHVSASIPENSGHGSRMERTPAAAISETTATHTSFVQGEDPDLRQGADVSQTASSLSNRERLQHLHELCGLQDCDEDVSTRVHFN